MIKPLDKKMLKSTTLSGDYHEMIDLMWDKLNEVIDYINAGATNTPSPSDEIEKCSHKKFWKDNGECQICKSEKLIDKAKEIAGKLKQVKCQECKGSGKFMDRTMYCPTCHGTGKTEPTEQKVRAQLKELYVKVVNQADRYRTALKEIKKLGKGATWKAPNIAKDALTIKGD